MARHVPLAVLALLAAAEIGAVAYAAIPSVSQNYRDVYLDRSSFCLERGEISGEYGLGTTLVLTPQTEAAFSRIAACGFGVMWPDGASMRGNLARLEFQLPASDKPLLFSFEIRPFIDNTFASQRIRFAANGMDMGTIELSKSATFELAVPMAALATATGRLQIEMRAEDTRADQSRPAQGQRDVVHFHWLRLSGVAAP